MACHCILHCSISTAPFGHCSTWSCHPGCQKHVQHGFTAGHTVETDALLPQIGGPRSRSPSKLDKIAEAAAAAVVQKQSQIPVVAGIVKSANAWDTSGDISVTIYPACKAHAHARGSCCSQVCHPIAGCILPSLHRLWSFSNLLQANQ